MVHLDNCNATISFKNIIISSLVAKLLKLTQISMNDWLAMSLPRPLFALQFVLIFTKMPKLWFKFSLGLVTSIVAIPKSFWKLGWNNLILKQNMKFMHTVFYLIHCLWVLKTIWERGRGWKGDFLYTGSLCNCTPRLGWVKAGAKTLELVTQTNSLPNLII